MLLFKELFYYASHSVVLNDFLNTELKTELLRIKIRK